MYDNFENIDLKFPTNLAEIVATDSFHSSAGKTDLSDFTFLFPLRIDSEERLANVNTVIGYISNHFETSFIIVEGDTTRKFKANGIGTPLRYEFQTDNNAFFHKTKYINRLIRMADTKYVAVWDADVIAAPGQILDSVMIVRNGVAVMTIPYDGRVYTCDSSLSIFFRNHPQVDILERLSPSLPLMYGYYSTGGAFMINKEDYLVTGGENENFYGWGPEDVERVKRMEIMDIPVHFSYGPLFHLWHLHGFTSRYIDKNIEKLSRSEFIKTCATIKRSE